MSFADIDYSENVNVGQGQVGITKNAYRVSAKSKDELVRGGRLSSPLAAAAGSSDVALSQVSVDHVSRPNGLDALHGNGVTGKGVTVAVIDSGISSHKDFGNRIKAFRDFTSGRTVPKKEVDKTGHGTHVAGIIAGSGESVKGIAPEAELVGCRISTPEQAVKAIDWVIANKEKYSIDILNLSLGVSAPRNPADDLFRQAAERAVDAGILVVAAAGNECQSEVCESTITSPGNSPKVITVGALDDQANFNPADDRIYASSSNGTVTGGKPDLVAEGVKVLAPLAKGSDFAKTLSGTALYVALSGSSQAAPMVAGALALMRQVNPNLNQDKAKELLKRTASKLDDVRPEAQGAGRLNLSRAVAAARRAAKA